VPPQRLDGDPAPEVTHGLQPKPRKAGAAGIAPSGAALDVDRMRRSLVAFAAIALTTCGDGTTPSHDSRGVLLVVRGAGKASEIWAIRPDGSDSRRLTSNEFFDDDPDWSPDGSRIVLVSAQDSTPGAPTRRPEVFLMNADGSEMRRLLVTAGPARHPRWSPDGTRIAFATYDPVAAGYQVYVMNSDGSNVRLLTSAPIENFSPEWSPDGRSLLFLSNRSPRNWWTMYVIGADGSGERLFAGNAACATNVQEARWSPDGSRIAYSCDDRFGGIFTIRADGTQPSPVSTSAGDLEADFGPVWSPDGRQLAFTRSKSGEVYSGTPTRFGVYVTDLSTGAVNRVTNVDTDDIVQAWGAAR
jgi:Tol biopolymer transport system component